MTTVLVVPATIVAYAHTAIAISAFCTALLAGWLSGLWQELCINAVSRWPIEWFPSVSAVVGDHVQSRAPFQILIALCACPRFLLLGLLWLSHRRGAGKLADAELAVGLARTLCCGGWMYVTSRDQHDLHDIFMIAYLILNVPWMALASRNSVNIETKRKRLALLTAFMSTIPPLIYMYYRHSVMRVSGAYTYYAFFEWSLVIWDIAFDAVAAEDLAHLKILVNTDLKNPTHFSSQTANVPPIGPATTMQVPESSVYRVALAWLSDVYLTICFWSTFTTLSVQLFYWSVWKLALAGSELALLANLSAFTMSAWASSPRGLLIHRVIMVLLGMGAYALPSPSTRLVAVSLATWVGWLAMFARLTAVFVVALATCMLLKYVNHSTNPFWSVTSSTTWNHVGLGLGLLAVIEYALRPVDLVSSPKPKPSHQKVTFWDRILITVGLGSLIHLVQTFLSDAGTVIAWTWTGYPVRGPTLHPSAGLVIVVTCLGAYSRLPHSILGPVGALLLYSCPDWVGFAGGLSVIIYISSLIPRYLRAASFLPPASTFGVALAINCVLDVFAVVTTAYAFVPFGWLLRERTDIILGFTFATVECGRWAAKNLNLPEAPVSLRSGIRKRLTLCAFLALSLVAIAYSYHKTGMVPKPYYAGHRMFTAGIWTVHFGIDEAGRDSQWRMRELIKDMQVDVLGLLETDLHRFVYGNRDLTRVIAEDLGYYVDLGPGPNKHTWGAALLSKFPIVNSTHHLLPSPQGELAPAIHATLDIHGELVHVMVSHNGQEEDALDRELQTTEIARLLTQIEGPTVFLGYLVTHPGDKRPWPYQILMEDGRINDIEVEDRWRWCEYIAFRGLWRIAYARVHEGDISDTELQVGKFLLPLPGTKVEYTSDTEMYWHIGEEDIPEPWRLPRMFWGEGVRGHHYTTWVGPLYYLPPERSGLQRYGAA